MGAQILQHFAPRHRALAPPEGPLSLLHEAFPVTDSSTYTNIFHALLLSLKVPASRAKKPTDWILYKHFLGLRALNESSLPLERVPSACRALAEGKKVLDQIDQDGFFLHELD